MDVYISLFPLLILLWALYYTEKHNKAATMRRIAAKKRRNNKMLEFAQNFVGKECIVYTLGHQVEGVIKAVSAGALLVQSRDSTEAVNLDYVIRIREYPRKKNGKKKSVVVD